MPNISSIVKNVRNIMRQDRGVSGDAQRLEQLGWLLFLKILDDKDQELELIRDRYQSVIPEKFQWRHWATDAEGITGEELILFIDHPTDGLFATLKNLKAPHAPQRAALVKEVFDGSNNYMKSGYELRKVINQLNGFDFNNSDDRHVFGTALLRHARPSTHRIIPTSFEFLTSGSRERQRVVFRLSSKYHETSL